MDLNLLINQIAILVFIAVIAYFLFPGLRQRKRKHPKPRHKQYSDSRLTDRMMEKIMIAYNVKEETEDSDEELNTEESINGYIENKFISEKFISEDREDIVTEIAEEPNEEVNEYIKNDSKEIIDEGPEEEINEDIEDEPEKEIDEEFDGKNKRRKYDDSRLTDYVMKKIMKAYNVKEEPEEEDSDYEDEELEDQNSEDVIDEEELESEYRPVIYTGDENNLEEKTGVMGLFSLTQLPITFSVVWFFLVTIIYDFFPKIGQSISKFISPSMLTVLPIFFLFGLSGLLGILFAQPNETLETTPKEKTAYILNIFKIIIGWGVGLYICLINF